MSDFAVLREMGFVLVAAAAALALARRIGLPPILAYILAGLVLGPATGLLSVGTSVELLSELGVSLLLFLVGLELSVGRIREMGRSAVVTGLVQMAVTLALGTALGTVLGFSPIESVFLGLAMTFSSTVVVVKLLERSGDMTAPHGRLSVGILLVQDVAVAVALTLVAGAGSGAGGGVSALATGLGGALVGTAVLAGAAAAAVRWGLPRLLAWLSGEPEALFVVSLTWCFAFILAAEAMHVSVELGAFVAGVALAQVPQCSELRRRVHPLVNLFLAIFFVALGAELNPAAAVDRWGGVLAVVALVMIGKPLLVGMVLGRLGHPDRTGFLAGLTLGQVSEFGFVLLAAAGTAGLVGEELLGLFGAVGLVTIGGSALLVPRGRVLYDRLAAAGTWGDRVLGFFGARATPELPAGGPEGHVVIVGMNALGRRLVRGFVARGERVVAVDTDAAKLAGLPAVPVVGSSDVLSVLEEAGVARARLVVSALHIEQANRLLAYRCREARVPVAVNAFDRSLEDELLELDVDHLMMPNAEGAAVIAAELRRAGVLG